MGRQQAVLLTLVLYNAALILIGLWAARWTRDRDDFFIGGRGLGAWVAGISSSASASSAWTLLGVSGAAFAWGLPALWLFPATVGGVLINWYVVAPRLMHIARDSGAITLTEVIAGPADAPEYRSIMRLASLIILFSFVFYIAAQFQGAGNAFASSFGIDMRLSILIGGAIILAYTLLGGFWAVSVTDTLQGLLMAGAALFLPLLALLIGGGWGALTTELAAVSTPAEMSLSGEFAGVLGLFFILGTLGVSLGYPGQPHVLNRFMALNSDLSLRRARVIAVVWAVIVFAGMLLLGLCARVFFASIDDPEQVFFEVANRLLSPVVAGVMIAAVLSAVMSTADSQLLVAASSVSHDLSLGGDSKRSLQRPRLVVVAVTLVALGVAVFLPQAIFSRVLFAWHAVGSSFGPLVLLRVWGYRIRSKAIFAALAAGFGLTVVLQLLPDTPGDIAERLVPFATASTIAFLGRER